MRIDKIKIYPSTDSINAEFIVEFILFYQSKYEVPIHISGSLYSEDYKKLSTIQNFVFNDNPKLELAASNERNRSEEKIIVKVYASLNEKVLNHLELIRDKNKKRDVEVHINITIKTLVSKTTISHMTLIEELKNQFQLPDNKKDAIPIFYKYEPQEFHTSRVNMWILSGNGSPTFLEFMDVTYNNTIKISSSDWVQDFCPPFLLGNFLVIDYCLPDFEEGSGTLEEILNKAINALKNMQLKLLKGEWNQVIEESRSIWELLRCRGQPQFPTKIELGQSYSPVQGNSNSPLFFIQGNYNSPLFYAPGQSYSPPAQTDKKPV